jgi:hypothetical protein
MKDLTFSAKGTGFVRLNGMDRMLVAIPVAFVRDQREFGDRQSKQSSPPGVVHFTSFNRAYIVLKSSTAAGTRLEPHTTDEPSFIFVNEKLRQYRSNASEKV